jgi:hypothetical protein
VEAAEATMGRTGCSKALTAGLVGFQARLASLKPLNTYDAL